VIAMCNNVEDKDNEPICFKCKHPVSEHLKDDVTGIILCHRIVEIKDGKPYCACMCSASSTVKEGYIIQ